MKTPERNYNCNGFLEKEIIKWESRDNCLTLYNRLKRLGATKGEIGLTITNRIILT